MGRTACQGIREVEVSRARKVERRLWTVFFEGGSARVIDFGKVDAVIKAERGTVRRVLFACQVVRREYQFGGIGVR